MEVFLLSLPSEIISYIIKFNDIKDLINNFKICKFIYNLILNDILLWDFFLNRDFKFDNLCISLHLEGQSNLYFYKNCYQINKLHNLQKLWLNDNKIQVIPIEIGQLHNLQQLCLGYNQIQEIPIEIGQLHNLQKLWLNDNKIQVIPIEIGQLYNLQILYLDS